MLSLAILLFTSLSSSAGNDARPRCDLRALAEPHSVEEAINLYGLNPIESQNFMNLPVNYRATVVKLLDLFPPPLTSVAIVLTEGFRQIALWDAKLRYLQTSNIRGGVSDTRLMTILRKELWFFSSHRFTYEKDLLGSLYGLIRQIAYMPRDTHLTLLEEFFEQIPEPETSSLFALASSGFGRRVLPFIFLRDLHGHLHNQPRPLTVEGLIGEWSLFINSCVEPESRPSNLAGIASLPHRYLLRAVEIQRIFNDSSEELSEVIFEGLNRLVVINQRLADLAQRSDLGALTKEQASTRSYYESQLWDQLFRFGSVESEILKKLMRIVRMVAELPSASRLNALRALFFVIPEPNTESLSSLTRSLFGHDILPGTFLRNLNRHLAWAMAEENLNPELSIADHFHAELSNFITGRTSLNRTTGNEWNVIRRTLPGSFGSGNSH